MPQNVPNDDATPHVLVGRAGLVFAFVCFAVALSLFGGAIFVLPLAFKAKVFLAAAAVLLTSMFAFMAFATYLVLRPKPLPIASTRGRSRDRPEQAAQKGVGGAAPDDADGSHRLR